MGLLSKLGGAAKEGLRKGAVNGLLKISGNSAATGKLNYSEYEYDANGNIKGVNSKYAADIANRYEGSNTLNDAVEGNFGGLAASKSGAARSASQSTLEYSKTKKWNSSPGLKERDEIDSKNKYNIKGNQIRTDTNSDIYFLKLPDWNYADFINERAIWQKGLSSIFDEPAWFYFKIFFDFDTNHGLFGGLLNDTYMTSATNSAAKYLYSVRNLHKNIKAKDRVNALYKMASILSYINLNAPWYFKSVKGLNKTVIPVLDEFSKERSIEIETAPEAIDMRLSTIMSLYNYACFDVYTDKEIIPSNLRKFNMSIILFQTPLRYLHTSFTTHENKEFLGINTDSIPFANKLLGLNKGGNQKVKYKSMSATNGTSDNFADMMSMKVITLYGCEFDKDSIGSQIPNDIANDMPFQMGKNTIKINYTEATEHTMNEFYAMMFGSDGFYFNQYSNFQDANGEWNGWVNKDKIEWNKQLKRYETLSETLNNMAQGGTILGIIDSPKSYKEAIDATESIMNGIGDSKNLLTSLGVNFALGLLGSSQSTDAPQGNLYGDYGLGSAYYKDKLEMLKNGVHERTQAPYYYDPYTGARIDLHKSKTYTAYNFKNDISSIKNFNVGNWVNNKVTDFGNKLNSGLRDLFGSKSDFVQNPYIDSATGKWKNKNNKVTELGFTDAGERGKTQVMVDNPEDWRAVEKPYEYKPENAIKNEVTKEIDHTIVSPYWRKNPDGSISIGVEEKPIYKDNHKNTEKPFNYDPQNAVKYENNKAGGKYKVQDMVDGIGNPTHKVTENPFEYKPENAVKYENNKAGGKYKVQNMVDKIGNPEHQITEKPFNYDPQNAVKYETDKSGGQYKSTDMVDDPNTWNRVEKPFNYNPKNAVDYENDKAGDFYKVQDMVDKIGNPEHQVTEKPFNYDPKNAVLYEQGKAGGKHKVQDMVDGIGNTKHQVTEKPFNYDPKEAVNYENSKAGGKRKVQDMVDGIGNAKHQVTEKPFNYDPKEAVNYENSKAGVQYKVQDMVDSIGNAEHEVTKAPFVYSAKEAVNYENNKAGGQYKVQDMVDGIGNAKHQVTKKPFNYKPKNAVNYENNKAGGQYKVQDMVDGIGNAKHQVTKKPFNYKPKNAVNYENNKAGGQYKIQDMVDGIGNAEHEVTEAPFNYNPKNAVSYEQGKAGGQYKVQDMVDGIGNAEHEVTEAPFNYDPKEAVNYENSKAGVQYKVQDMVDDIGNAEHQVTEKPFNYDPKNAVSYEQGKAGRQYKVQDMVDGIGNAEHEVTEAPFNYNPKNAVSYEQGKAGGEYKSEDMVDGIGNVEHAVTEKPFNYDPKSAIEYEQTKKK